MSMSDIKIYRDYAVINGYVQVPPNFERDKSRMTLDRALNTIDGSILVELTLGSGRNTGSRFGAQRFLRLPPLQPGESYRTIYGYDPQITLSV